MTRKDFIAIAEAIAETRRHLDLTADDVRTLDYASERLAIACHETNPRFDRSRFLSACGVQS